MDLVAFIFAVAAAIAFIPWAPERNPLKGWGACFLTIILICQLTQVADHIIKS